MKSFYYYICFLLLPSVIYAQNQQKDFYIQIEGAYILDGLPEVDDISRSTFNFASIALKREKGKNSQGFTFEFYQYNFIQEVPSQTDTSIIQDRISNERKSYSLQYDYSFIYSRGIHKIIVGPSIPLRLSTLDRTHLSYTNIPWEYATLSLGLGNALSYDLKLGDRLAIVLSSRITLMDLNVRRTIINNPLLIDRLRKTYTFHLDIISPQYMLKAGLKFKLNGSNPAK